MLNHPGIPFRSVALIHFGRQDGIRQSPRYWESVMRMRNVLTVCCLATTGLLWGTADSARAQGRGGPGGGRGGMMGQQQRPQ